MVVPVPPLATPKVPETSLLPKAIAPLNNAPAEVERTGKAEVKLAIVVEPLAAIWKSGVLEEEATVKTGSVGKVEVPCTTKVELGVVEPIPTEPLDLTIKKDAPEEEVTWNGSRVVEPWTLKEMAEDVAFTPATVELS